MQISVGRWRKEGVIKGAFSRSWKHIKVKGLSHDHGTCHLKAYKKNFFWVFPYERERFWPWHEEAKLVSFLFLVIDLMKDIIS